MSDNCEKSVFLGTKRHPERYECELPEGHDGLHRAEAASHNFMTGSDDVLLHWQKVEDEDTADADTGNGSDEYQGSEYSSGSGSGKATTSAASEDVSEKSLNINPAAYVTGDGTVEGGALELHWPDEVEGRTFQTMPEPLYSASKLSEIDLEELAEFPSPAGYRYQVYDGTWLGTVSAVHPDQALKDDVEWRPAQNSLDDATRLYTDWEVRMMLANLTKKLRREFTQQSEDDNN